MRLKLMKGVVYVLDKIIAAYLRCVKNIITTTNTSNINVDNTPIVAIVPRFIRPSSPKVTQPGIKN